MPTVADVITRVSRLRSKKATLYAMRVHLQTHYIGSEAGPPVYSITRDDNALVPETHIADMLDVLEEQIEAADLEMKQWEQLLVVDPEDKKKTSKANGKRGSSGKKSEGRGKVRAEDTGSESSGSRRVV